MKLILTSSGLETPRLRKELSKMLNRHPSEAKVFVIHSAQKSSHLLYVHKVGEELARAGILHPNITYVNIASAKSAPQIENYDVVYVCGGNTFYILKKLRQLRLDKAINKFVRSGGIYVGVSAGSILAGEYIEIAGWGSEGDSNEVKLKDLQGLHFTNISVFPHYKERLKREVLDFKKRVSYPVEILRDKEALIIEGKRLRRIK
ncbi:MAG: Type 1 glutamine amidotransferase-like domain-containing protein [Nanoarchaeota archaeon]|nr:Type 1 glutamine amidotransferase-like domain-containing protein [Nanoarchaeota archaeon]